jgi:hypothetical protein
MTPQILKKAFFTKLAVRQNDKIIVKSLFYEAGSLKRLLPKGGLGIFEFFDT